MSLARARAVASVLGKLVGQELSPAARRRHENELDAEARTRERARHIREAFERLGPFYVKVGQILSTRPDVVRPAVIEELRNLHDRVATAPFAEFEDVLAAELGDDWKLRFIDLRTDVPLGTASLAQVYAGTFADGTPVAVKIQRPGVRADVLADMAVLRKAAHLLRRTAPRFCAVIDVEAMLEVVFDAMQAELDFVAEARNMDAGRRAVQKFEHLSVPEVVLATPRVLVQTLAPGMSIRDADSRAFDDAQRLAIGRDLLAYLYQGFFVEHLFHADPHPGNIFVQPGVPASLIDWGMVGRVDRRTAMAMVLVLITLAQNDAQGLARAWAEMGRATPWADLAGFSMDMATLVPKIAGASLGDLDFGITLTAVLKHSTRRGIQTNPAVAILGKAFGNIEGSIRYLAPELSLVEVFEEQLRGVILHHINELLSEQQAARTTMELIMGLTAANGQLRGLLRDLANRELFKSHDRSGSHGTRCSEASLLGGIAVLLWLDRRCRHQD